MKGKLFFLIFTSLSISLSSQTHLSKEEADKKADVLISQMTLDEKISMTRGYNNFFFNGIPRLNIPYLYLSDATQGVNMRNNLPDPTMVRQLEKSTAFPCPIMLSATFNPELAYDYARAIGEECRAGGIEVLLGPGINIYRNAQCGRNFEYFGEDPWLVSRFAENYVKGMQSTGTAACLKHFLANSTEFYRRRSNSILDERTMREIYVPAFEAGIKADAACVMTSYNRVNGEWTGESKTIIKDLLLGQLGFGGLVMTDWNSVYDMEKILHSGQNVEMPGNWKFKKTAKDLIKEGKVTEKDIENAIKPLLSTCYRFGLFERIGEKKYNPELLSKFNEHEELCLKVASEGVVLLSNSGVLPLKKDAHILLTGKFINKIPRGEGAAAVKGYNNITLGEALKKEFAGNVIIDENPTTEQLKQAEIVIVSAGTIDAESIERPFALPGKEESLILNAVKSNPNTIVLVNSGSGIRMTDWASQAGAVIYGWYPGQNGFKAISKILSGEINPSGKLPMTIEQEFRDSPGSNTMPELAQFYKECRNERLIGLYDIPYDEGILVGYRWYETKGIKPLYPFGHGLSYTTFEISKPKISKKQIRKDKPVTVSVRIKNTGLRKGAEVVQLYIAENAPEVLRPVKELKGIKKIELEPGDYQVVEFEIEYRDLAFWCEKQHAWRVKPGEFTVMIGQSSADIAQRIPLIAL